MCVLQYETHWFNVYELNVVWYVIIYLEENSVLFAQHTRNEMTDIFSR